MKEYLTNYRKDLQPKNLAKPREVTDGIPRVLRGHRHVHEFRQLRVHPPVPKPLNELIT